MYVCRYVMYVHNIHRYIIIVADVSTYPWELHLQLGRLPSISNEAGKLESTACSRACCSMAPNCPFKEPRSNHELPVCLGS